MDYALKQQRIHIEFLGPAFKKKTFESYIIHTCVEMWNFAMKEDPNNEFVVEYGNIYQYLTDKVISYSQMMPEDIRLIVDGVPE